MIISFGGEGAGLMASHLRSRLNSTNTGGSFTMANSNSFFVPTKFYPIAQENKYLEKLSYFIMELFTRRF